MAFAGWNPLDFEGHRQTRWCRVLIPPALEHLKVGVNPQLAALFNRIVPLDNILRQLFYWLLHGPLPELRVHARLTNELDLEYTRITTLLLPPGVIVPIEETMRNLIRDRRFLIDEDIPMPYRVPPAGAPETMNADAVDWFQWEANVMSDGDDEAVAAQILLRMRPSILEGIHPWGIQARRKALTQCLWTALIGMIPLHETTRFERNARWLIDPVPFELRDMLMTFQYKNFNDPRAEAGLPILNGLCPFTE